MILSCLRVHWCHFSFGARFNFINRCRNWSSVIVYNCWHLVSTICNTASLLSPQINIKNFSPRILPPVVILKASLGLPTIFYALSCRNRSNFHHMLQLDARSWQVKFHKWSFVSQCLFPQLIWNSFSFLLDVSQCV